MYKLISNDKVKAPHFHAIKRVIDDLCTFNEVYKGILVP